MRQKAHRVVVVLSEEMTMPRGDRLLPRNPYLPPLPAMRPDRAQKLIPVEQPDRPQLAQIPQAPADKTALAQALLRGASGPARGWGDALSQVVDTWSANRMLGKQHEAETQRQDALFQALTGTDDPEQQAMIALQGGDDSLFKALAGHRLERKLNPPDPRDSLLKDYQVQAARQGLQPKSKLLSPEEEQQQLRLRRAGASSQTVTMGSEPGDSELRKSLDKKEGEVWSAYKETGATAASMQQDFQVLDELIAMAPQGPLTGALANAIPGVSSAGDAFNSIVKRIAPTLRAPGSGSTSDIEYDGMLRSLPNLRNRPEANQMIAEIMKAKAQMNMQRSGIVTQYQTGELSAADTRRMLGELDKQSIITPEMKQALGMLGGNQGPQTGDIEDGYRLKGGDPADPNNWEKVR